MPPASCRTGRPGPPTPSRPESSIRNLANDGTSQQSASWPWPGRAYWLATTKLSLRYPHDRFGGFDGAHDTDSIGLYQQRPAYGWGDYGVSNGRTDPAGVVRRLLDPRWQAMAFFGGGRSAAPTSGLLDIAGWELRSLNDAAQRVQQSGNSTLYGQWAALATSYVDRNQAAPPIDLPWYPGGGRDLGGCAEPLVVGLKAWANGRFVCAENGGASSLVANHGAAGPWETFMLVPNPDSSISLRSAANGRLLTAEGGGGAPLIANRITVGQWEKFDLVGA